MNNVPNAPEELSFSKAAIGNSEFGYRQVINYFTFMAIYSLLTNVVSYFIRILYYENIDQNVILKSIFMRNVYDSIVKMIFFIPVFVITFRFHKKLKQEHKGFGAWLFEVIGFVILFCGLVLPIIFIFITPSYDFANLFVLLSISLCILLCGIFSGKNMLKVTAYLYFLFPVLPLAAMVFYHAYIENYIQSYVSTNFSNWFSYVKAVIFGLYPSLGYSLIAVSLKRWKAK